MRQPRATFAVLLVAVLLSMVSVSTAGDTRTAEAFRPGNLIRLHIIANSDSDEDQGVKLKVRDAVLKAIEIKLADKTDADEAYAYLIDNSWIVNAAVESVMSVALPAMAYRTEFGVFDFPDRTYGDKLVPAGSYRALRIVLGEGNGRNWWCVLFPPLCFKDLTQSTEPETLEPAVAPRPQTEAGPVVLVDEGEMKKIRVEHRFKILEWAKSRQDEPKQMTAHGQAQSPSN